MSSMESAHKSISARKRLGLGVAAALFAVGTTGCTAETPTKKETSGPSVSPHATQTQKASSEQYPTKRDKKVLKRTKRLMHRVCRSVAVDAQTGKASELSRNDVVVPNLDHDNEPPIHIKGRVLGRTKGTEMVEAVYRSSGNQSVNPRDCIASMVIHFANAGSLKAYQQGEDVRKESSSVTIVDASAHEGYWTIVTANGENNPELPADKKVMQGDYNYGVMIEDSPYEGNFRKAADPGFFKQALMADRHLVREERQ